MAYPGAPVQEQRPWNPADDPKQGDLGNDGDSDDGGEERAEPAKNLANAPKLPPLPGYDGVNFQQSTAVYPPQRPPPPMGDPPPIPNTDLAKLDETACRDAMIQHVNEHCCYGSKPAKELKITKMEGVTALHLTLETFSEGRKTKNKHEPYRGGMVDGPENGHPPMPWDINVPPNELFNDHKIKREVPHTSVIKPCWGCDHRGWNRCWRCNGCGRVRCMACSGRGHTTRHRDGRTIRQRCFSCGGRGRKRCYTCGGDGRITCTECQGFKDLRCFVQLICKFLNHDDSFILETTDMPDELVADVGGTVIFQDVQFLVRPMLSYPVQEINANSNRLVKDHEHKWPDQRTLKQRQTLRGVPVTEVAYEWNDVQTRYWVYGNERRVYAPDYPHQCCCGCSII